MSVKSLRHNPRTAKVYTEAQVEAKQDKAVRFLRDVVGDDEKADEIEGLSVAEYAERKRIRMGNPKPTSVYAHISRGHIIAAYTTRGLAQQRLGMYQSREGIRVKRIKWEQLPPTVRLQSNPTQYGGSRLPAPDTVHAQSDLRRELHLLRHKLSRHAKKGRPVATQRASFAKNPLDVPSLQSMAHTARQTRGRVNAQVGGHTITVVVDPWVSHRGKFPKMSTHQTWYVDGKKTSLKAVEQLVSRSQRSGNPNGAEENAEDFYRTFHGGDPNTIIEGTQDIIRRKDYAALGKWLELRFKADNGEKIDVEWKEQEAPLLASNALSGKKGNTLYAIGGNQDLSDLLARIPGGDKDFVRLGEVLTLGYLTRKDFDQFEKVLYTHKLGEEGGARPDLMYDALNQQLYFVGGEYVIERPGIIN